MQRIQFKIEIHASSEKVWNTLWQDETFREWAGVIDQGTYMVGEFREGSEVQFISAENGYGVTSLVERLIVGEFVQFRHSSDTKNSGSEERTKEWTGGIETYELKEGNGITRLTATFDVPAELVGYFELNYPKALDKVKELSER